MDQIHTDAYDRLQLGLITLEDVVTIMRGDILHLTEADLAAILCNIMTDGPHPVARIVEPVIRQELVRRRSSIIPTAAALP